MKSLIIALMLATATVAQAQHLDMPKTIKVFDNKTKEVLGTATISGRNVYFRDKYGVHYATQVYNQDGTRTLYDPSGKKIDAESLKLPQLPPEQQ